MAFQITVGRIVPALGLAAALMAGAPALAADPSFDCATAESDAEREVCSSDALSELDRELARLYALARETPDLAAERMAELTATQRGWVKGRDECWKADSLEACITQEYLARIMDLRQGYAHARSEDDLGLSTGPQAIACQSADYGIGAVFVSGATGEGGQDYAVLRWNSDTVGLTTVPSASVARYEGPYYTGETVVLETKGTDATFTPPGGDPLACVIEEIG